jgi:hypothetical protein
VDSDMHSNETNHSWYMDFLYTCTKNVRNATILAYIDPQFDVKLGKSTMFKAYSHFLFRPICDKFESLR